MMTTMTTSSPCRTEVRGRATRRGRAESVGHRPEVFGGHAVKTE